MTDRPGMSAKERQLSPLPALRSSLTKRIGHYPSLASAICKEGSTISVISPGAGLRANKQVYAELERDPRFRMKVLPARGELQDRYPDTFKGGAPAPNLESYAKEVLACGIEHSDGLIAGSRGGQVVLPYLWRLLGDKTPPAIVINGGCAMRLPTPVQWPKKAVTVLILGGRDYFKWEMSGQEYVSYTESNVCPENSSTAILYVREMEHMPTSGLLSLLLRPLLQAAIYWKVSGYAPAFEFEAVAQELETARFSGELSFLEAPGAWRRVRFGGQVRVQSPVRRLQRADSELPILEAPASPASSPKSRMGGAAAPAARAREGAARVKELEREVSTKEEELLQLLAQLSEARAEQQRLEEAVRAAAAPPPSFGLGDEEQPTVARVQSEKYSARQASKAFSVPMSPRMSVPRSPASQSPSLSSPSTRAPTSTRSPMTSPSAAVRAMSPHSSPGSVVSSSSPPAGSQQLWLTQQAATPTSRPQQASQQPPALRRGATSPRKEPTPQSRLLSPVPSISRVALSSPSRASRTLGSSVGFTSVPQASAGTSLCSPPHSSRVHREPAHVTGAAAMAAAARTATSGLVSTSSLGAISWPPQQVETHAPLISRRTSSVPNGLSQATHLTTLAEAGASMPTSPMLVSKSLSCSFAAISRSRAMPPPPVHSAPTGSMSLPAPPKALGGVASAGSAPRPATAPTSWVRPPALATASSSGPLSKPTSLTEEDDFSKRSVFI